MTIKKLKGTFWIAVCDICGEDVFGYDYIPYYNTKLELQDAIEQDYVETQGKTKHFCSYKCWNSFADKVTEIKKLEGKKCV